MKLKTDNQPIGIITLIRRDYLEYPDIGFAFLPEHTGKGYAREAAKMVIDGLKKQSIAEELLAITVMNNFKSIKLLEKLGFRFLKEMMREGEKLLVYTDRIPAE